MKRKAWDRDESLGVATLAVVLLMVLTALYAPQIRSNLALMQAGVTEESALDRRVTEGDVLLPVEMSANRRKPAVGRPEPLSGVTDAVVGPSAGLPRNPVAVVPARRGGMPSASGGGQVGSRALLGGSGERITGANEDERSPRENEEPWPLRGLWRSDEQSEIGQTMYIEFLRDGRIRTFVGRGGEGTIDPHSTFTLEGSTVTITQTGPDGEIVQEFRGTVNGSLIQGMEGPVGQMNRSAIFERVE